MEGFAFAKICKLKKVNFFCFKYISDIVGDNQQEVDWIENYHKGRFLLKESVMKLL
jgi:nucleoside phosphorylase